jgi:hypothetical protein
MSSHFEHGASGDSSKIIGTLAVEMVGEESKSAHSAPVLTDDEGCKYKIFVVGDNQFENETLQEYIGTRISVLGIWRNGTLRVEPSGIFSELEKSGLCACGESSMAGLLELARYAAEIEGLSCSEELKDLLLAKAELIGLENFESMVDILLNQLSDSGDHLTEDA